MFIDYYFAISSLNAKPRAEYFNIIIINYTMLLKLRAHQRLVQTNSIQCILFINNVNELQVSIYEVKFVEWRANKKQNKFFKSDQHLAEGVFQSWSCFATDFTKSSLFFYFLFKRSKLMDKLFGSLCFHRLLYALSTLVEIELMKFDLWSENF